MMIQLVERRANSELKPAAAAFAINGPGRIVCNRRSAILALWTPTNYGMEDRQPGELGPSLPHDFVHNHEVDQAGFSRK